MQQTIKALLLGAGVGLAAAMPANSPYLVDGPHKSHFSFASSGVRFSTGTVAATTVSSASAASTAPAFNVKASNSTTTSSFSSSNSIAAITASSDCTFTDADSVASGKYSCTTIALDGITVAGGVTLDLTDLTAGTTVQFQGTTTFEYDEWEGPLISFSGTGITINGASGHLIDGNGAKWWDGKGSNGGVTKPKFFYAHKLIDSVVQGLNVLNTSVQGFSVNGASNLLINDVTIDNSAEDGDDGGHNTDAFDVGSSTGVYIDGATIYNQDDCLVIHSGTDISFTNGYCSGGHGLSIGSVGGRDDNDVADVYIACNTIIDSDNGVRIKAVSDATGSVKNVTYTEITLSNIAKYGIVIEQDYENGSPTGETTDGVPITEVTLTSITGSVADDAQPCYILCASCSDWTITGVDITGGSQEDACEGDPSDLC